MPQVHCYINQKMEEQLEESITMKEMLSLGIKVYLINQNNKIDESEKRRLEKEEELQKMHTTYLLRIMELSADILRCVYDKDKEEKSQYIVSDQISLIKKKVDEYITNYVNN